MRVMELAWLRHDSMGESGVPPAPQPSASCRHLTRPAVQAKVWDGSPPSRPLTCTQIRPG